MVAIIVLAVEMLNSAVEETVNILFKEYDQRAKIIKDIAAGAALITAIGASLVGYVVLVPYFRTVFSQGLNIAKQSREDLAVISLVVVLIMVIITKTFFGRGLPLKGGMPSGHALPRHFLEGVCPSRAECPAVMLQLPFPYGWLLPF
jgi:diacylglycerol kinase (ATP)